MSLSMGLVELSDLGTSSQLSSHHSAHQWHQAAEAEWGFSALFAFRRKKRRISEGGLGGGKCHSVTPLLLSASLVFPSCWEILRGFRNAGKYQSKSSCLSISNLG